MPTEKSILRCSGTSLSAVKNNIANIKLYHKNMKTIKRDNVESIAIFTIFLMFYYCKLLTFCLIKFLNSQKLFSTAPRIATFLKEI